MRLFTPFLVLATAAMSAGKVDAQSSDTLGAFEITIDSIPAEMASFAGPARRRSGIMVINSGDRKILVIEGAASINDNGRPVLPLLSITMISDTSGQNFTLESVRYTAEDDGSIYTSDSVAGQQTLQNLVLEDGEISFDFSSDLVPRAPNSAGRSIVEGVDPIQIEGQFSGAKSLAGIND